MLELSLTILEWILELLGQRHLCVLSRVSRKCRTIINNFWLRRGLDLQDMTTAGCAHLHMPLYQQLGKLVRQKRFSTVNRVSLIGMDLAAARVF